MMAALFFALGGLLIIGKAIIWGQLPEFVAGLTWWGAALANFLFR